MEFKLYSSGVNFPLPTNINRITVEFKLHNPDRFESGHQILIESQWNLNHYKYEQVIHHCAILIESQWNLNFMSTAHVVQQRRILIESQWNLNEGKLQAMVNTAVILIESQWNLNFFAVCCSCVCNHNINRITVEFKFFYYIFIQFKI